MVSSFSHRFYHLLQLKKLGNEPVMHLWNALAMINDGALNACPPLLLLQPRMASGTDTDTTMPL
jgi:hypothetical protein